MLSEKSIICVLKFNEMTNKAEQMLLKDCHEINTTINELIPITQVFC